MRSSLAELGEALASLRFQALSASAREKLPLLVLDVAGCAAAGARLAPYRGFAGGQSESEDATLWFHPKRSDPAHAALVNGTLAHHIEMDDGHAAASFHGGVTVIPAAVALGEAVEASGRELLTAIACGYAAGVACGRVLKGGIDAHRLHPPSMIGCIGAAAAAARLLRLDAAGTANSLAIAGTLMPLGPFESFTRGASSKDLYGGWPAFTGIRAAVLARHGISGPLELFTSERDGVGTFLSHAPIEAELGIDWDDALDVYIKPFATCRAVHASLTALERLLPLEVHRITGIDVETYRFAAELSRDADPTTPIGAKTSIPYALATLILEGSVGPDAFTPRAIGERERRALAERVGVRASLPAGARVTVHFNGGASRAAIAAAARSESNIRAKFRALARKRAETIESAVRSLESAPNLDALRSALTS